MEFAITRKDSIITSYRDHCQMLARGGTVKEVRGAVGVLVLVLGRWCWCWCWCGAG
jgi:TPP-dependent pyruvate/acetoin dehydrogenase alpha subunit